MKINKEILKKIKDADYVIYNLEGPIALDNKKYFLQIRTNKIKNFLFKLLMSITNNIQPIVSSNISILDLLKINKNTLVTLANNHVKDLGLNGFNDTIKLLETNEIYWCRIK